ncbi:Tad domain-containing protein [Bacillus suaedaesalsae]|uniref:Tad domain-containing protein n=1 Tax=Bacillus suaedaesalsae TaxID=2810349 RepID=A0ABS2DNA6_9BACI|nr:Tad domain-containing protein [Bacillus suaedaesalsae]MBM6619515.1 Tad domain-containing protein [Bacillus suaedaesalsae]
MKTFKQILNRENGNAIILVTISLMVLLTMAGLVIDGGKLYVTKSHLQKAANASVLSGAQKLLVDEQFVNNVVNDVLDFHEEKESLQEVMIEDNRLVRVSLNKEMPLSFSTLFGLESSPVFAKAAAEIGTMGKASGAVPIGIDERFELEFYKEYQLKTDSIGNDTGWFGILSLGGSGADTYYENFMNGYDEEIKVGDVLSTETGNVAGKTRSAIEARIDQCPYTFEDAVDKKCSRIILIPVYRPVNVTSNQIKEVQVVGFAYFYLTRPATSKDTSVHGMFIKTTGPGTIDPNALNRGAYSIRLTE